MILFTQNTYTVFTHKHNTHGFKDIFELKRTHLQKNADHCALLLLLQNFRCTMYEPPVSIIIWSCLEMKNAFWVSISSHSILDTFIAN